MTCYCPLEKLETLNMTQKKVQTSPLIGEFAMQDRQNLSDFLAHLFQGYMQTKRCSGKPKFASLNLQVS